MSIYQSKMKTLSEIHTILDSARPLAGNAFEQRVCELCGALLAAVEARNGETRGCKHGWRGKSDKFLHAATLDGWDWSKTNGDLAAEHGVSKAAVSCWRHVLKKPHAPNFGNRKCDSIDWMNYDSEIARTAGVSRERVRQLRLAHGKPKHRFYDIKFERFAAAVAGRKDMDSLACMEFGVSEVTAKRYCKRIGLAWIDRRHCGGHRIYPWSQFNWRLPSRLLTEIWQAKPNVVASYRSGHKLSPPAFRYSRRAMPPQFAAEVDAERAKAARWFATKNSK